MKKAKIILSVIALLAIIGGTVAIKTSRTLTPAVTLTSRYIIGGLTFVAVTNYCIHTGLFITTTGAPPVQTFSTDGTPSGEARFVRGTATLIIPTYVCNLTTTWTTNGF
jgi:hypothetical protein